MIDTLVLLAQVRTEIERRLLSQGIDPQHVSSPDEVTADTEAILAEVIRRVSSVTRFPPHA